MSWHKSCLVNICILKGNAVSVHCMKHDCTRNYNAHIKIQSLANQQRGAVQCLQQMYLMCTLNIHTYTYVVYTNRKWSLPFPQCVLLQYVLLFLNLRYIVESLASPSLPLIARLIVVYTKPILNPSFSPILTTTGIPQSANAAHISHLLLYLSLGVV